MIKNNLVILGISAVYHDSAAALIVDGEIVFAVHEERLTRKKHDSAFPVQAIWACLEAMRQRSGNRLFSLNDIDAIIIMLLLIGALILFTSGSAIAPFIYTIF